MYLCVEISQLSPQNGQGWTVIQKRIDGAQDFYKGWADYKAGFGSASHEYWIGLDNLAAMTAAQEYELR